MPERGSRCLSNPEEEMSAYADRLANESFRMGTIFESEDDYDLVILRETEIRTKPVPTNRAWGSWCSNDSYGGGSACDEFGLEGNSGTWGQEQQEMYDSWQAEGELGSSLFSGEMAGYFGSATPTDSDRSSDEEESSNKDNGCEDDDDDCWEAWLDARKSNKATALKEAEAAVVTKVELGDPDVSATEAQVVVVAIDSTATATAAASTPCDQIASTTSTTAPALLPTPDYGKLHDSVYDPAEDSFILLDALEADAAELRARKPTICLEIGSGSGIASTFLSTIVEPSSALFLSTDINPHACLATLATSNLNQAHLNPINTNLVSPILERIEAVGGADVLVFNPPYVPTEEDELTKTQLEAEIGATWAGGADGMVVTNIVLDLLPRILNPNGGTLYLVAVSANQPAQIIATTAERGFHGEVSCALRCCPMYVGAADHLWSSIRQIVLKRRAGIELLHVLKLTRR
jgi:release factor glutamine methyltransferase